MVALSALVMTGLLSAVPAQASPWDHKTIVTVNAPVEIPGRVLTPGTYVLKRVETDTSGNIVQIFDKNETHLYGTIMTVADFRLRPTDHTVLTLGERAAGSPEAIETWFYPGNSFGHEFLYHR